MCTKKVLVIDDEADFGLLLKAYFSKKGYEVYLSNTLADGMKLLNETKPDFLFLDNNLPDGLGWDETEFIIENYPSLQINLISAYRYDVPKQINPKTVQIWEKPIDLTDLNGYFASSI
ncbi:MAG: response regulator [Chitinophagaceae bacterium]